MSCQLKKLNELGQKNVWLNNLFQKRIKLIWSFKRNVIFIKNKILHIFMLKGNIRPQTEIKKNKFAPGDLVRVRSKLEIQNILDDWGGSNGCCFIPEMYAHCGKTYKVLKAIDYFFDEFRQKMCKCKSLVILEGVVCSGHRRLFNDDCDRSCFLFWHTSWLEKLNDYTA